MQLVKYSKTSTLKYVLAAIMIAMLFFFAYYKYQSNRLELDLSTMQYVCNRDHDSIEEVQDCINDKIVYMTNNYPELIAPLFELIEDKYNNNGLGEPLQMYSPIIHDIGMQLVENNASSTITDILKYCPLSLRGGCIHGVIMEYIDNNHLKIDTPGKAANVCSELNLDFKKENLNRNYILYKNCVHAVGHEIVAQNKMTLNSYLNLCKTMSVDMLDSCVYGVYMEYSKGESGSGRHSESPVGSIILPCEQVDKKFKKECYISIGFYRQYEANTETKAETLKICNTFPSPYSTYCIDGVAGAY